MATHRADLPVKKEMLLRPRVHALLAEGLTHSVVPVVAAHGYGKTYAVASYMQEAPVRLIWMRTSQLDNVPGRFFRTFVRSLGDEFPRQAAALEQLGMPDSLSKFDGFLRILAEGIYSGPQTVLVIDDFHALHNPGILANIALLLEANMENFCTVLISSTRIDMEWQGWRTVGRMYTIGAEALRFTPEETQALFALHGVELSPQMLRTLTQTLDGWPFPLFLLAKTLHGGVQSVEVPLRQIVATGLHPMLEKDYFTTYPPAHRWLLIKLSLLSGFSQSIAYTLAKDDGADALDLIASNLFIAYDSGLGLWTFQHTYQDFLRTKHIFLTNDEKAEVYLLAAETYRTDGHTIEAIECFEACGRYEAMLDCILSFAGTRMGLSRGQTDYLLQKLNALPDGFAAAHPVADYIRANLYLSLLRVEDAQRQLELLIDRIPPDAVGAEAELLGEAWSLLGGIRMMQNRTDFGRCYEIACRYLPEGTQLKRNMLLVENNRNFSLADNTPGALERMERAVHTGIAYLTRAMNGGHGIEHLYSAEAAFNTLRLDRAQRCAYDAIHTATENGQHDILCNAHLVLAEIAAMQGDYAGLTGHVQTVETYINEHDIAVLYDLRDYAVSWQALLLEDPKRLSFWIMSPQTVHNTQPMITIGRDRMLHAWYLFRQRRYLELLSFLDTFERLSHTRGLWTDHLNCIILTALTHHKLGNTKEAVETLLTAYGLTYHNDIVAPLIIPGGHIRPLLEEVLRSGDARFDLDWIRRLLVRANTYAKRLASLARTHAARMPRAEATHPRLSRRETEILRSLSQGLTREEIAAEYGISINTVKTILTSVYNKLGAINRADAIRIAVLHGLLEAGG